MQMLACLEMPEHDVVDVLAARDNGELIKMVMQCRRRYLDDCPIVTIPGRTFPVAVYHSKVNISAKARLGRVQGKGSTVQVSTCCAQWWERLVA